MNHKADLNVAMDCPFRLGEWLVEPRLNRLTRDGESIQIELKMMDVLVCLAEYAGELVERQQLIDTVWATEFISENILTRAIAELRNALGDDAKNPSFIETIHRRGYRLIGPVEAMVSDEAATGRIARFPVPDRPIDDERSPYPGLAPFTEEDAEFFFGREVEVAHLWRKITTRRLLAVIGPSGVGKSSFLRAGIIPAAPEDWAILICQPGETPFAALAGALAPEFREDSEAVAKFVDIGKTRTAVGLLTRWRERYGQALLIVDQFEEVFTQNPQEVQERFANVLGRVAREADIHVLLSMRDDFHHRCHEYPALGPVFDSITPISVPTRADLRKAVTMPAADFGFGIEDEGIVDGMLDAVEGERGGLPLLAFTIARLWEARDSEGRLLTRQAYEKMGGIQGALAQHAEASLSAIGPPKLPVVREIFRNLVTAQGTRATREIEELLSVFEDPDVARQVLSSLIDGRLLTSYEVSSEEGESRRIIEIVHESLLDAWPRLVRWQTQDADAAQLRDDLRQAARLWGDHDLSTDFLWTGKAFRQYSVWRENYPGGLSELEEAFSQAMIALAKRRKRRRRIAVVSILILALAVATVFGALWRRSTRDARRAEAANLFSLAQLQLEERPTDSIAYAIASLELADNPNVRRLVLDALWRGPTEFRLQTNSRFGFDFSPDGRWLATADKKGGGKLWPSDGGPPTVLECSDVALEIRISPRGDLVAANLDTERRILGLWSFPEGRFLRSLALGDEGSTFFFPFSRDGERLITCTQIVGERSTELFIRSWTVGDGEPQPIARFPVHPSSNYVIPDLDPTGSRLAWADGRKVRIAPLVGTDLELESAMSIEHDRAIGALIFDPQRPRLATVDKVGTIRIWSLGRDPPELIHTLSGGGRIWDAGLWFDPSGSILASGGGRLWDLAAPPDADPLRIHCEVWLAFDPKTEWVATSIGQSVSLWPLAHTYPWILRGHEEIVGGVAFTPDGDRLVSTSSDGSVRVWPLLGRFGERSRVLDQAEGIFEAPSALAMAPDGAFVAIGNPQGRVRVLPLDGGPGRELSGFTDAVYRIAVDPEARLVAAGSGLFFREEAVVRVWDLKNGKTWVLDAGDGIQIGNLEFSGEGDLWVESNPMLRRWDLGEGKPIIVEEIDLSSQELAVDKLHDIDPDGREVLLCEGGSPWIQHLDTHESRDLSPHGSHRSCRLHADHEIVVSTDLLGGIRVGSVTGEEPHLLLGREGGNVAVSADGQWIASGGVDSTIRIWPMPDLSKPPLHTLPREEIIANLKALTNLRVVRDESSPTGWKVEAGPFPGWAEVPEW